MDESQPAAQTKTAPTEFERWASDVLCSAESVHMDNVRRLGMRALGTRTLCGQPFTFRGKTGSSGSDNHGEIVTHGTIAGVVISSGRMDGDDVRALYLHTNIMVVGGGALVLVYCKIGEESMGWVLTDDDDVNAYRDAPRGTLEIG